MSLSTREAPAPAGPAPTNEAGMTHREVLQALSGLMLGMFVAILSSTVVSNALPTIVADLHGSQSGYTWVVTATLLATTISTPIWGKLSDLVNKKLLVQIALVVFAVSSMIAGLSQNMGQLITMRVFQGLGAGGLTSLSQVIIATIVSPRERGRYSGYLGATFALGTVAGPLIGGGITEHLDWRWCFYVGVPFAIAAILVLQKTLHLPAQKKREVHIDYLGAALLAGGVSSLLIWVSLAGDSFDWWSWQTGAMVGGGLVLLALTVMAEQIAPEPMIPLRLFRKPVIVLASLASLFVGIGMFAGTVFLGQYFQLARGDSPMRAGLATLPMILGLFLSSTVSGQIITKTGKWKMWLVSGGVLLTAGLGLLGTVDYDTSYWVVALWMFLVGIGIGMMMQNLVLAVQNEVPPSDLGAASSFVAFTRTMGGAIGVSALGALLGTRVKDHLVDGFTAAKINPGSALSGGIPHLADLPEGVRHIVEEAYGKGISEIFLAAAPFALVAFLITLFIKETALRTKALPEPGEVEEEAAEQMWNSPEDHTHEERLTRAEWERLAAGEGALPQAPGRHAAPAVADAAAAPSVTVETTREGDDWRAVSGLVTRPDGSPWEGAAVTVLDIADNPLARTSTGPDGSYRLDIPADALTGRAVIEGSTVADLTDLGSTPHRAAEPAAFVDAAPTTGAAAEAVDSNDHTVSGQPVDANELAVQPVDPSELTVSGQVDNGTGGRVAGARVTVADQTGRQIDHTIADANGGYRLVVPTGGTYLLIAAAEGVAPFASLVAVNDRPVRLDVTLSRSARVAGRVLRRDAETQELRPADGALVTLTDVMGAVVGARTVHTDAHYAFDGLTPGSYVITAQREAHRPTARTIDVDGFGESTQDLVLTAGGRLQGVVVAAADGLPVREAIVTVTDAAGNVVATVTTGEDGRYDFSDLDAGQYSLTASGYAPVTQQVAVDEGTTSTASVELGEAHRGSTTRTLP